MKKNKIFILCGGKGTRLGLKDIPKPLALINRRPILEWIIQNFINHGYKNIVLLVGHKYEKIQEFIKERKFQANISFIVEDKSLGTLGALYQINKDEKDFFLAYGDVLTNINPQDLSDFSEINGAKYVLTVHPNDHPYDSDSVDVDDASKITKLFPKDSKDESIQKNLVNAAFYFFKDLPKLRFSPFGKDVGIDLVKELIESKEAYAFKSFSYLKDMGTPDRLKKVNKITIGFTTSSWSLRKNPAIFFDRDDTIISDNYYKKYKKIKLLDYVGESIKKINQNGYLAICITNQPAVAKGFISLADVKRAHDDIEQQLIEYGSYIDHFEYCPHHPEKGFKGEVKNLKQKCDCRKPASGMFSKSIDLCNIDITKSYSIGDHARDIIASNDIGIHSIYIGNKEKYVSELNKMNYSEIYPNEYVGSFKDAINSIFQD